LNFDVTCRKICKIGDFEQHDLLGK